MAKNRAQRHVFQRRTAAERIVPDGGDAGTQVHFFQLFHVRAEAVGYAGPGIREGDGGDGTVHEHIGSIHDPRTSPPFRKTREAAVGEGSVLDTGDVGGDGSGSQISAPVEAASRNGGEGCAGGEGDALERGAIPECLRAQTGERGRQVEGLQRPAVHEGIVADGGASAFESHGFEGPAIIEHTGGNGDAALEGGLLQGSAVLEDVTAHRGRRSFKRDGSDRRALEGIIVHLCDRIAQHQVAGKGRVVEGQSAVRGDVVQLSGRIEGPAPLEGAVSERGHPGGNIAGSHPLTAVERAVADGGDGGRKGDGDDILTLESVVADSRHIAAEGDGSDIVLERMADDGQPVAQERRAGAAVVLAVSQPVVAVSRIGDLRLLVPELGRGQVDGSDLAALHHDRVLRREGPDIAVRGLDHDPQPAVGAGGNGDVEIGERIGVEGDRGIAHQ